MGQVRWTAEAQRWLHEIYEHIARDNANAAARTVAGIYDKVQFLRRFPELGYRYEQATHREIRIILFGHYRIAYLIKPSGDIDVLGVFHAALEIGQYLE